MYIYTVRHGPEAHFEPAHLPRGSDHSARNPSYSVTQQSKWTPQSELHSTLSLVRSGRNLATLLRLCQSSSNAVQNCSEICFASISERPMPAASHPKRHCQTMTTPDSSQFPIVCPVSLKAKSSDDLRLTIMMEGWRALLEVRLEDVNATHSTW